MIETAPEASGSIADTRPWWKQLNRYHWYVFALCAMGWLFDTMDQKIFTASRQIALEYYLPNAAPKDITSFSAWVTSSAEVEALSFSSLPPPSISSVTRPLVSRPRIS